MFFVLPVVVLSRPQTFWGGGWLPAVSKGTLSKFYNKCSSCILILLQVTFPNALAPAAVEVLEKVLPPRPDTEFDGEEEEPMLEVLFCHDSCVV